MGVPLADSILKVLNAGLEAYKTHLSTRQEAYNRKADKKQVMAIEKAEKLIFEVDELVNRLKQEHPDAYKTELGQIAHFRAKFFKYH